MLTILLWKLSFLYIKSKQKMQSAEKNNFRKLSLSPSANFTPKYRAVP